MKQPMWKLNKVGDKIAYYLSLKGWSQQMLADKLGTTQQSISRWIKGQTEPSLDDVLLTCYFLGEDANELLGFNDIAQDEFAKYNKLYEATGNRFDNIIAQQNNDYRDE